MPDAAFVLRPRVLKDKKGRGRPLDLDELPYANGQIEIRVRTFQVPGQDGEPPQKAPRAGLILSHSWVAGRGGRGAVGRGRMLLPAPPATLFKAGLGEAHNTQPRLESTRRGARIWMVQQRVLADVVLGEKEVEARGDVLIDSLTTLICEGRLKKGLREMLEDHLFTWDLFYRWPNKGEWPRLQEGRPPPKNLKDHLAERMKTLGLQSAEDLELLEDSDFKMDLVTLFGTDPASLEKMATEFPRVWSQQGATYEIVVNPTARRVLISPANKKAKKAKEPDGRLLPRFRGFKVLYQQASRTLTLR
jgi:hypothetical protein